MKPNIANTIVADIVTNKVKYIPVADATAGKMSNETNTGVNINPVPAPHIVPTVAPKKETKLN